MPWEETEVIEERMKFIAALKSGGWTMTDLCREFGISRKTGYKYLERYESEGLDALKDRSRARKHQAHMIRPKLVDLVVAARKEHKTWGSRKLLASLMGRYPSISDWPSPATIGRILSRKGLIQNEKKRRRRNAYASFPLSHALDPNDVWCADFKGHFTVGSGQRCDPLTITDAYSRYLVACQAVKKTDTKNTQKVFENAFRELGLPAAIRTDNGTPFAATNGLAGMSRLSAWWLRLGIQLERIEPGKPQQNGRHERMHRTLKQETALPPRSSLRQQQGAFDDFRYEYNFERPHEALKNRFPGEIYKPSVRTYPEKLPEVAYATNVEPHRVSDEGTIYYALHRVFISSSLAGEVIGLEEISDRHMRIHFAAAALGVLDVYTGKVLQYQNPQPTII